MRFWIFIGKILGVKIFKRYWIVKGSYWNTYHINKNSIYDLESVIEMAIYYKEIHYMTTISGLIVYNMLIITNNFNKDRQISFLIFSLCEIYSFIIQQYNIELAEKFIKLL